MITDNLLISTLCIDENEDQDDPFLDVDRRGVVTHGPSLLEESELCDNSIILVPGGSVVLGDANNGLEEHDLIFRDDVEVRERE